MLFRSLTILEDYLDHFNGIVIAVSHDRYFLDRVVRRIFAFQDGEIRQYEGGFTDYQVRQQKETTKTEEDKTKNTEKKATVSRKTIKNRQEKLKFSYKEQKEYETIEEEITSLEEKLQTLEEEMVANGYDFVKLNELTIQKESTEQLLEEKMERWMYLQDLAEKMIGRAHV